jgi:L-2-hydroxyglutarate oxidase LhgO
MFLIFRKVNPDWLAGQPAVPRVSRGMIYLARGAAEEAELDALLRHAAENKLTDVRRIDVAELEELEPALNTEGVTAALFSNTESIVDPWLLGTVYLNKF